MKITFLKTSLTFVIGVTVGSAVTLYYLKDKYAKIAQDEIDSVKEVFYTNLRKTVKDEETKKSSNENTLKKVDDETLKNVKETSYKDYSSYKEKTKDYIIVNEEDDDEYEDQPDPPVSPKMMGNGDEKPYIIREDEFDEFDDYSVISLYYYADKKLADDNDQLVEDVDDVVGFKSLEIFDEHDIDTLYVRNDRLKVDFEILRCLQNYSDIIESKPYLRED